MYGKELKELTQHLTHREMEHLTFALSRLVGEKVWIEYSIKVSDAQGRSRAVVIRGEVKPGCALVKRSSLKALLEKIKNFFRFRLHR